MRALAERYRHVRAATEAFCAPLAVEDQVVQTSEDASPAKWHLAHTAWFFETMVLAKEQGHRPFHERYGFLFNSYYEGAGERVARPRRGLLSRPTVAEVHGYRRHVDERMLELLARTDSHDALVELGLHHEQQHQELLVTDVKTVFAENPLHPVYRAPEPRPRAGAGTLRFVAFDGGLHDIGHDGAGFSFDNERPRHRALLHPFALANRPITNREWLAFIDDRGYRRPELWLSDGWAAVKANDWRAPLYWVQRDDDAFSTVGLFGLRPLDLDAPVSHVSLYEADAFARWAGARLPTEQEWEHVASRAKIAEPPKAGGVSGIDGNFADSGHLDPVAPTRAGDELVQLFGDVWEWTQSAYAPYPGFRPLEGVLGEYNGKFMCNQVVLRGGSCATPRDHVRATYRNFFPPSARWQFSGVRLAR